MANPVYCGPQQGAARPPLGLSAVIFDVDGTLLDTESVYTAATNAILSPYNYHLDWNLKQKMMGRPAIEAVTILRDALNIPETPEALLAKREMFEHTAWPQTSAMPGAQALVCNLHSLGIPLGIATGGSLPVLQEKASSHPWFSLFSAIVTGDDPEVAHGKPAPDCFCCCARRLGVDPANYSSVLVVEDGVLGVEGALAAGMRVLAVPDPNLLSLNKTVFVRADQLLASLEEFDPAFWGLPSFSPSS